MCVLFRDIFDNISEYITRAFPKKSVLCLVNYFGIFHNVFQFIFRNMFENIYDVFVFCFVIYLIIFHNISPEYFPPKIVFCLVKYFGIFYNVFQFIFRNMFENIDDVK